jgi:predicted AlkP superfamily phosphohydrolase/phosphomutase
MIYLLSDEPADRDAVVTALTELRDPEGNLLDMDVYRPDDLYAGPKTELGPDILFTVDDFNCAVDPRYSTEDDIVTTGAPSAARSGGHRMNGIYCFSGPGIESGDGREASLLDIAPTILYALDEPIPTVMNGDVLTAAFTEAVRERRTTRRQPLEQLVDTGTTQADRDTDAVEDRLEDLGYI